MLTLCIDTAYKYLTCALIKDNEILAAKSYECFKKQSEEVFACLDEVYKQANINKLDIDSICISKGPGSYTGVRIAMSIAKVISQIAKIDLYTISTLQLYASNKENAMVILNARADRAYVGVYDKSKTIIPETIMSINEIDPLNYLIVGDGNLIGKDDNYLDLPSAFLDTKDSWQKVKNIAYLVPEYLKESESYFK